MWYERRGSLIALVKVAVKQLMALTRVEERRPWETMSDRVLVAPDLVQDVPWSS